MQTVSLSEVGGLNTLILAKLGTQKLAILTSDKVAKAVVLPLTSDKQVACQLAKQYIGLVSGNTDAVKVSRLRGKLQTKLANHGRLKILRRGVPVAILLPPPGDKESAERGAMSYLEALGIAINNT